MYVDLNEVSCRLSHASCQVDASGENELPKVRKICYDWSW